MHPPLGNSELYLLSHSDPTFIGSYGNREGHITRKEYDSLVVSGKMVTASVVNGYLSILIRPHQARGVRRLDTTFYTGEFNQKQYDSYKNRKVFRENIDWDGKSDKIIFIPIFVGDVKGGHFSLLVLDRIIDENGIFVYFDSMKTDTFEKLQRHIQRTDLWLPDSKFIRATSQEQATGSNDCGIFACAFAASYMSQKHVIDMIMGNEDQSGSVNAVKTVDIMLPSKSDEVILAFGQSWRGVMGETFRNKGKYDFGKGTDARALLDDLKVVLNKGD